MLCGVLFGVLLDVLWMYCWVYYGCTMGVLWVYYGCTVGCTMDVLWMYFGVEQSFIFKLPLNTLFYFTHYIVYHPIFHSIFTPFFFLVSFFLFFFLFFYRALGFHPTSNVKTRCCPFKNGGNNGCGIVKTLPATFILGGGCPVFA